MRALPRVFDDKKTIMSADSSSTSRSPNLEDIAAQAGVSRSTVSRVINNDPHVSDATRKRVLAVIKRVGYAPNPAARALVTQRTQIIGVVIPQEPITLFEDTYYFPTLLHGISRAAHERDYAMLLWLAPSNEEEERFRQRIISNRLMDGVVLSSATTHEPLIDHFLNNDIPFVMTERPVFKQNLISYVSVDNTAATFDAVSHLIALGRKRIGTITGHLANSDGLDRLDGYKMALESAGMPVDERLIAEGNFTHHRGYLGMKQLLQQQVDAVFAASDITTRGALEALDEAGVRVPDDVALVSFDDLQTAEKTVPSLTTVHHPIEEKGMQATSLLIDLIENEDEVVRHILLPTRLVIRESCGAEMP
jgi:LacI family transcriptional regulator